MPNKAQAANRDSNNRAGKRYISGLKTYKPGGHSKWRKTLIQPVTAVNDVANNCGRSQTHK
jgi:hypothetical protein